MEEQSQQSVPPENIDVHPLPIPVLTRSPDSVADTRIDAILRRFSWFASPSHEWYSGDSSPTRPTNIHYPVPHYHLRRRPQIRCPACLQGELGQMAHMQGPDGCLYSEELDAFHNVENE